MCILVECRSDNYPLLMGLIHPLRTPPLASFIDFLWYSEGYRQPHAAERILPTGAMDLVVDLADHRSTGGTVSGAHSTSVILDTSSSLTLIGARFKPGGGCAFFDVPAGELHNISVSLDALWEHDAERLREELYRAADPKRRFLVLESFLLRHFSPPSERKSAVQLALRMFHNSHPSVPVARVADRTERCAIHCRVSRPSRPHTQGVCQDHPLQTGDIRIAGRDTRRLDVDRPKLRILRSGPLQSRFSCLRRDNPVRIRSRSHGESESRACLELNAGKFLQSPDDRTAVTSML